MAQVYSFDKIEDVTIYYYGLGFIKITIGEKIIALNPPASSALKTTRFGADLTLVSVDLPGYNSIETTSLGEKKPAVLDSPGEYEIGGVFIRGLGSLGPEGKINIIWSIASEDINLCHLGALAKPELAPETKEALGEIDILFVPTYGEDSLAAPQAHRLATVLEPKIIVPLFYAGAGKDYLRKFLKEEGEEIKPEEKLSVKKKDLSSEESKLAVIKSF